MDPLSVTASVIAVLQLTGTVLSYCYEYRLSVKSAASELKKLTDEVVNLRDILEQLLRLSEDEASKDPNKFPALQILAKKGGALGECSNELLGLKKKLAPASGFKAVVQKLTWPFKEGDVRKSLENLERFKATLSLALNADHTVLALETKNEIANLANSFAALSVDLKLKETLDWLAAPNPYTNLETALSKKEPETGLWLVQGPTYQEWVAKGGTVWLHGIPGCGKTVLCSTVIEEMVSLCQFKAKHTLVYFYFDFADSEKLKLEGFLQAALLQLVRGSEGAAEMLKRLHEHHHNGAKPRVADLEETFSKMVKEYDEVFIVLDALDECHEREDLLDFLERLEGWNLKGLHLFFSSRNNKDIEESLGSLVDYDISVGSVQVQDDIERYVHSAIQSDRKLKKLSLDLRQEIENVLVSRSHGMFQWVVCQLGILKKCLTTRAIRLALDSLPSSLSDIYNRIISLIDPEQQDNAIKILSWLVYSLRPVTLKEVAEALAVQLEDNIFDPDSRLLDPRDLLTICSGLVSVSTIVTENETVEVLSLAHFSIKEYLVSSAISKSTLSVYGIRKAAANRLIGKTCLVYLLEAVSGDLSAEKLSNYPLVLYAAENWPKHVGEENLESEIGEMEIKLFSNKHLFSNWLRIFDEDESWKKSDLTKADTSFAGPLYYTSILGLQRFTKYLLDKGINPNDRGGRLVSPLYSASRRGHSDIAKLLVENGADVNGQGYGDATALHAASYNGDMSLVLYLLDHGAHIEAETAFKMTPLEIAVVWERLPVVELLLEKGANVNSRDHSGRTSLMAAAGKGNIAMVKLLIENGAGIEDRRSDETTALIAAAEEGHDTVISYLLDQGADLHVKSEDDYSALHYAAMKNRASTVRLLLHRGALLEERGSFGQTPLITAVRNRSPEVTRCLIEAGANMSTKDLLDCSAPDLAAMQGDIETFQVILELGGGKIDEDTMMKSIMCAAVANVPEILQLIADWPHLRLSKPESTMTCIGALQHARTKGYAEIVEIFTANGIVEDEQLSSSDADNGLLDGHSHPTAEGDSSRATVAEREQQSAALVASEQGQEPTDLNLHSLGVVQRLESKAELTSAERRFKTLMALKYNTENSGPQELSRMELYRALWDDAEENAHLRAIEADQPNLREYREGVIEYLIENSGERGENLDAALRKFYEMESQGPHGSQRLLFGEKSWVDVAIQEREQSSPVKPSTKEQK